MGGALSDIIWASRYAAAEGSWQVAAARLIVMPSPPATDLVPLATRQLPTANRTQTWF